ncbi:GNAT family N-acetyltransferase [Halobacterium yunchengense]|uniref:GNAT family N-acetyltransferase n=1 Tax=Halobacterium yunchengense TaxID=3108497 RepID=UPI0030085D0D
MPGPVFLASDRVTLRPPEREDLDAIREWLNDPCVWRPGASPNPMNDALGEQFFEDALATEDDVKLLACAEQDGDTDAGGAEPIGVVGLAATQYGPDETARSRDMELMYYLDPDVHGQGYGTESVGRVVQFAFEDLNLRRLTAYPGAFNDASVALLESLGFQREGARRDAAYYRGDYYDLLTYGLLREEWNGA